MGPVWAHSCLSSVCLGTDGHNRRLVSSVRVQSHGRRCSDFVLDIRNVDDVSSGQENDVARLPATAQRPQMAVARRSIYGAFQNRLWAGIAQSV